MCAIGGVVLQRWRRRREAARSPAPNRGLELSAGGERHVAVQQPDSLDCAHTKHRFPAPSSKLCQI